MMEEASTSETSVNFYQTTRCNNPADSNLRLSLVFIMFMPLGQGTDRMKDTHLPLRRSSEIKMCISVV
jgi:hypothetical protein